MHSPALREAVRANWRSAATWEGLFSRLLLDLDTRGSIARNVHQRGAYAPWEYASATQAEAARRLLYYDGDAGDRIVADRLAKYDLTVPKEGDDAASRKLSLRNGGEILSLLSAASAAPGNATKAAIVKVARETQDVQVWLAAARRSPRKTVPIWLRGHASFCSICAPRTGVNYGGSGYGLLSLLLKNAPTDARKDCKGFLAGGNPGRIWAVGAALIKQRPAWAARLLSHSLDDQRVLVKSDRWRVCDAAAEFLHQMNPRLRFNGRASLTTRDRQIAAMARVLR